MSWIATAVSVGVAGYSAYSSSKAASKNKIDMGVVPEWYEDPKYKEVQDYLYPYGKNILEGKLPDFYSTLGKTGTPEFENMLALINRDTAKAVNENLVRRNISRGGVGLSTIAKSTADVGTNLRWADFLRANQEKAGLLTTGIGTLSDVRSAALNMTGQRNQFDLAQASMKIGIEEYNAPAKAAKEMMWANILSSMVGGASSGYTMGQGLNLGSAGGGAGTNSLYDKLQGQNIKFGGINYNM